MTTPESTPYILTDADVAGYIARRAAATCPNTLQMTTQKHTHTAQIDGQPVTIWDRRDLEPPFSFTWCYDCQQWIKPRCPRHHIDAFA